jgi:flagellar motor switch/type III secretory pathway protein FliN
MTPPTDLGPYSRVPVLIDVALDCGTRELAEVLEWSEGSLIRSVRPAGDSVDIHAGGRLIGSGEIVAIEGIMGVRITSLRDVA